MKNNNKYEKIHRTSGNPNFDYYMYSHLCFQWNITSQKNTLTLLYVDSLGQKYKKKIVVNKDKNKFMLSLKENWKTLCVNYNLL